MSEFLIALRKGAKELSAPKFFTDKVSFCDEAAAVYGGADRAENERYLCVLDGHVFLDESAKPPFESGLTDTALILALFEAVGPADAPKYLNGCFSYCVYDRQERELWAARDRLGARQLYYTTDEEAFWVSTDFLPLFQKQGRRVRTDALQHYFTFSYVPEPMTIGEDVFALTLGTTGHGKDRFSLQRFNVWKPAPDPEKNLYEFQQEIRTAMTKATRDALEGSRTVAAFLSGGLDSSILAALAAQDHPDMTAYTIAFDVPGFSEAEAAAHSCEKYGIRHQVLKVDPETFTQVFAEAVRHLGVPVGDPSATAVSLIAREAVGKTDVIISGEGSDELWGGYHSYRTSAPVQKLQSLPKPLKSVVRGVAKLMPDGMKGKGSLERGTTPLRDRFVGNTFVLNEKEKQSLLVHYDPSVKFTDITGPYFDQANGLNEMDQMQFIDVMLWLPGDIDVVAGKCCSMRGLNVVTPFMDNRVTDLARRLTYEDKLSATQNKIVLRETFADLLTDEVRDGIKKGYPVPVRIWLKNELYEWAEDLIQTAPVDEWIRKDVVLGWLKKFKTMDGDLVLYRKIWAVIVFCQWVVTNLEAE